MQTSNEIVQKAAEIAKPVTFVMACRTFFGVKPGQSLQEFVVELRELTPGDKADFIAMFATIGVDATKTA